MDGLEHVIAEVLRISVSNVTDALRFNEIPEWDSLSHVNLMVALESAYSVSIDEDRMLELTDVAAIRQFIGQKNLNGAGHR